MTESADEASADGSWERGLRLAFSKRSGGVTSTWKMPDASATPLPDPSPAPALKTPADGALLAEPYEVMGEVGRGGIGIVLQARDLTLGREVAVKMLQPRHQSNPGAVARFTREAKIAAQLQHPGIVPVYAAGQDELDRPYIAMKLLRGSTLEELLEARKTLEESRPRFLRIFEQVCQTMAYAHSRGVIHRDLKPGNVMVGAFGEVQIIDWGFARVVGTSSPDEKRDLELLDHALSPDESSALSVAGAPIGTPAYMAPEQALGDVKALDERTDVFCLGSILCEILTGAPPQAAMNVRDVMDAAAKGDLGPAFERLDRSGAEADLLTLAKDCLRPAKTARPANAAAVAERVSAFLAASEERVRKAELAAVEERQKKRLVVGLSAAVLLAGLAVAGLAWSRTQKRQAAEFEIANILSDASALAGSEDWTAAEQRVLHARAVLTGTAVREEVARGIDEKLAFYRAKQKEHEALQVLFKLRMHSQSPPHEMNQRYADAFRKLGMDIDRTEPEKIGRMIRARGGTAAETLIVALDDWILRFRPDGEREPRRRGPEPPDRREPPPPPDDRGPGGDGVPGRRERVIRAAMAADSHPWRNRARAAILAQDRAAVDELLSSLEKELPPPQSVILLTHALGRGPGSREAFRSIMLRAYHLYPNDYWINFILAHESIPQRGAPDGPTLDLWERHARLAVSLNPENLHSFALLAGALLNRARTSRAQPGDPEEGVLMLRRAARDDGPFGDAVKIALRYYDGDREAAREEARREMDGHGEHPPMLRALLELVLR